MDSLTHIALGACIGEAFFEKGFGKKAMIWGALAQSVPDIDFIAALWQGPTEHLMGHRGFTHSVVFALLVIPLLGVTADWLHQERRSRLKKWVLFFAVEILVHLFLDGFNNYGVGWLEPFSHRRFSFNMLYVADPFFSIAPGIAVMVLAVLNGHHARRGLWWKLGVFLPLLYLGYALFNKISIQQETHAIMSRQSLPSGRVLITPAPFQNWLWYIVSSTPQGYYVGYRSVFDNSDSISFQYFPRQDSLLGEWENHSDGKRLLRFSQQYYTVERWGDTLVFNDLRFGQVLGWHYPKNKFAFHYYLNYPDDNKTVVQRGRFEGWNREEWRYLLSRIKGDVN